MATKFTLTPGLDSQVALMVAPEVREVAKEVAKVARQLAPETKKWVNRGDSAVRHTHVTAPLKGFNQDIPVNLRFAVDSMTWDMTAKKSNKVGPTTWMKHPIDWSSGAVANNEDCRCEAVHDRDVIRRKIRTEATRVSGPLVRTKVTAHGNRIVASEFGEFYDHKAPPAEGLHWMGKAARMVAAWH